MNLSDTSPLHRSHFHYALPDELIAQYPLQERTQSRLLVLDQDNDLMDQHFNNLTQWLFPGDLLVFNNTKVLNARLFARKPSGGRVEVLVERLLDEKRVLAHLRLSKPMRKGGRIQLDGRDDCSFEFIDRMESLSILGFEGDMSLSDYMTQFGHMPLPPYIARSDDSEDQRRYQTVYAKKPGAIAAPTAGLHFDQPLIETLKNHGIKIAEVTLHVGSGTFRPIRSELLSEHSMHSEFCDCSPETVALIQATRAKGGRVVAVGTTVVRCLEAASSSGKLLPWSGETRIFIYQGYRFRSVDALITNFHLPESTLLALVCAFAGHSRIMNAYAHAIEQRYRFFSYGDAMFIYPSAKGMRAL